jgi:molybdopterin synthase catalytic subunit
MSEFRIVADRIDCAAFRDSLVDSGCGGYVQFEGWVRDRNDGREVLRLEYEVYEPLAVREGRRIIEEATARFGVTRARAVHRSGLLELSDVAVVVGVAAPHRAEAFAACRYIIDAIKQRLPSGRRSTTPTAMLIGSAATTAPRRDIRILQRFDDRLRLRRQAVRMNPGALFAP